jgi:hypothetical protein
MGIEKEEYYNNINNIEEKEMNELISLIVNIKDVTVIRRLKYIVLGIIKFTQ